MFVFLKQRQIINSEQLFFFRGHRWISKVVHPCQQSTRRSQCRWFLVISYNRDLLQQRYLINNYNIHIPISTHLPHPSSIPCFEEFNSFFTHQLQHKHHKAFATLEVSKTMYKKLDVIFQSLYIRHTSFPYTS